MSSRDIYIPTLTNLIQPKLRYLGDKPSLLSIVMLREAYILEAINLKGHETDNPVRRQKTSQNSKLETECT